MNPPKRESRGPRRRLLQAGVVVLASSATVLLIVALTGFRKRTVYADWADGINVVLISMDTTRKDALGCYRYERNTSPHLDALAAESLVFDRCVAVSNWTLPTHASMLTGLFPTSHGAHYVKGAVSPIPGDPHFLESSLGAMSQRCESLAEVLSANSYRTKAIVGNAGYLQRGFHLDQGFDDYDDRCPCYRCQHVPPGPDMPLAYRRAEVIVDEALTWLAEDRGRPFFLFVNFMDPHVPYFPTAPYNAMFRDELSRRWESRFAGKRQWPIEYKWYSAVKDSVATSQDPLPPEIAAWLRCQYDGEVAYMDAQIGRLLAFLREQHMYDRTLIIVTGDHGENFGEHRLLDHGVSHYEPELAVPMIVKVPGSKRKGRIAYGVQHVDVMPTVLDVLGRPVPSAVQGRTMLAPNARDLYVESHYLRKESRPHRWAVYRGDLKLIVDEDGRQELYDVALDPQEQHDLAGQQVAEAEDLHRSLEEWRDSLPPPATRQTPSQLRPQTQDELRDVGYIQ